jgi:hypothetical protein
VVLVRFAKVDCFAGVWIVLRRWGWLRASGVAVPGAAGGWTRP